MIEIQLHMFGSKVGSPAVVDGDCSEHLTASLCNIRRVSEINFYLSGEALSKLNSLRKSMRKLTDITPRVCLTCGGRSEYFLL